MGELIVDFITSLDGYASGKGWPGWWGLEGPEYLGWLNERPDATLLMGANTYRLMSGFAAGATPAGVGEFSGDEDASIGGLPYRRLQGNPPRQIRRVGARRSGRTSSRPS